MFLPLSVIGHHFRIGFRARLKQVQLRIYIAGRIQALQLQAVKILKKVFHKLAFPPIITVAVHRLALKAFLIVLQLRINV